MLFLVLFHYSPLLFHCSIDTPSLLFHRSPCEFAAPSLAAPSHALPEWLCSCSRPQTEADGPKFGTYIMYTYSTNLEETAIPSLLTNTIFGAEHQLYATFPGVRPGLSSSDLNTSAAVYPYTRFPKTIDTAVKKTAAIHHTQDFRSETTKYI